MAILKFRSRRQRDPFTSAQPPAAPAEMPAPCGWNADGWPLVRDSIGVRPATGGEMIPPHGIATKETLAGLVEQAQAEKAAQAPAPDLLADEAHRWYGWDITALDVPPRHDRPYIPGVLGAEGRLTPLHAGVSDDLGSLPLFRDAVRRISRPACEQCRQATGTWQERLYGTYKHHTWAVPDAAPREFGIATELRQAHGETAADADDAEAAFARRYPAWRAA